MVSKKIETEMLPLVGDPEHQRELKSILLDFERRIGKLEKVVLVTLVAVCAVGGREYIISALAQMVK